MAVFNLHSHFFYELFIFGIFSNQQKIAFHTTFFLKQANAKSHTHLQFAPAHTSPKIAKEYVLL